VSDATLVLPLRLHDELKAAAAASVEAGFVLLVSVAEQTGPVRLLGRELHPVPDRGYLSRDIDGMTVTPTGYLEALARAEMLGAAAVWVHTHPGPGSSPRPSDKDTQVDRQLADTFRIRTGQPWYGAVVFATDQESRLTFSGHVQRDAGEPIPVSRLWAVGDRLSLTMSSGTCTEEMQAMWDRNVRAFGADLQRALGELHVTIVGCGGTGSAVAEQVSRLGVRHLHLIDADKLSESNLTRVYGSTPTDVGHPKAEVLAAHVRRIAPEATVTTTTGMLTMEPVARQVAASDVVFGCTDDNAGRLVLSRLATYYLTPVFDCGVLISSTSSGVITGIDGRVTVMTPGQGCLLCRDRIDLQRAASELMTPSERIRLAAEGYAPGLPGIEPSVITYTTLVAALAVGELLERLIGYGPIPVPGEILARCHDRELSSNIAQPRPGHYCDPAAGQLGRGDISPFLGQTWPA
jgi:molybdopterin/thiamine biosynthesis adenylyltransferase